jgi:hypothetical protein
MEQAAQIFTWTVLVLPAILTLVPLAFFAGGYQISRKDTVSVAGRIFYWLGWHGVTLVMVALLTVLRGKYIPDMVVTQLPLLMSVVYLIAGRAVRSPFFAALGLATPGLWVFLTKVWQAFSGAKESLYMLPQEPFWFLLAAAIIFGLLYYPGRPGDFWEDCGPWFATISGCYLMGGLWLLALGQPSLLAVIGVGQHVWAVLLIAISVFLFWCARYMRDPLFMICGVCGFSAGLYAFMVYYPWQ